MAREHDLLKRRWVLKMDILSEDPSRNIGIVTESVQNNANLKLHSMIDKKVTCIAKNYHVDEERNLEKQDKNKLQTKNIDFPQEFP